jgi:tetratricopeptide (TPR) repeat protein
VGAEQSGPLTDAGWALVRVGNSRGAVRQFEAALAADPENAYALAGLAQSHLNLDELAKAEEPTTMLLRISPNYATGHRLRAEILRRRRRPAEAAKIAREAIRLDPRDPLGYHILGLAYSDQKQHKAAIKICDEGLAIAPASFVLLAQRAAARLELSGPKAADEDSEAALRLSPTSEYALRIAARIAIAQNRLDRARDLLSAVLRRNANSREAISLFLMTEPKRHRILRAMYIFRYWRRSHGGLGWAAYFGLWTLAIIGMLALVILTNVPGLLVGLGVRFFLNTRYQAHAKEVQAHFAQFALNSGF